MSDRDRVGQEAVPTQIRPPRPLSAPPPPPPVAGGDEQPVVISTIAPGHYVSISTEQLADMVGTGDALRRWFEATPEERAGAARRAADERAAEREAAGEPVEPTLLRLIDKLGWSPEYARHVVQPYCYCGPGYDAWERCAHAVDLGIEP